METQKGLAGAEKVALQQSMGELRILNAIRHDNILPLYGYSLDGTYPCLVYEFMPNGSLEDRLMCRQGTVPLSWRQRLNIARGTARGLNFLHSRSTREKPLIHGDIKSGNILLDKAFDPKIGDFGLAREGPQTQYTHIKVSFMLCCKFKIFKFVFHFDLGQSSSRNTTIFTGRIPARTEDFHESRHLQVQNFLQFFKLK